MPDAMRYTLEWVAMTIPKYPNVLFYHGHVGAAFLIEHGYLKQERIDENLRTVATITDKGRAAIETMNAIDGLGR